MSILKIKNNDTFISIPTITGAQGPAGPQGPKGEPGISGTNIKVSTTEPSDSNVEVWINPTAASEIDDLQAQIIELQNTINKLSRKNICYLYNVSSSSDNTAYTFSQGDGNSIGWNAYYKVGDGFTVLDTIGTVRIDNNKIKTVKVSGSIEWTKDWLFQFKISHFDSSGNPLSTHYGCIETGLVAMNHVCIPDGIFVNCNQGDTIRVHCYSAKDGGSINIRDRRHINIEAIEYYD
jgi:hypothetical protein